MCILLLLKKVWTADNMPIHVYVLSNWKVWKKLNYDLP